MSLAELFTDLHQLIKEPLAIAIERPIAIYGAGNAGKELAKILKEQGFQVKYLIDQKAPQNAMWQGIPVLQPMDPAISQAEKVSLQLVLGIFNRETDLNAIVTALRTYGYKNINSYVEIYSYFSKHLQNRFWLSSRDYYLANERTIQDIDNLWEDEASRKLYRSLLSFRLKGDYADMPRPERESQYLPAILPNTATKRFVDCGAYNGDTLLEFINFSRPLEAVAAFEPDPNNFAELAEFVHNNKNLPKETYLWPCGVFSDARQLKFASTEGEGSHVSEEGNTVIQCVALDQALPNFEPTMLKMDIEGAEYEALLGAQHLITTYRPTLAICLYHCPEHLWQIPTLIHNWNLGYKFYLHLYGFNGLELVMYAVAS